MSADRAGSTSRRSGNLPAIIVSRDFSPKIEPPMPYAMADVIAAAEDKGFLDARTGEAEYFFSRISYQHASEYFDLRKSTNSLKTVHRAILFDRKFQALLMEYIGLFELQFRAQYSYAMTTRHGAFAHRDRHNFRNQDHFSNFLKLYREELSRQVNHKNHMVLSAYEEYGDLPTWQAVEIMSFGTLSKLFNNTRDQKVRHAVADSFNVDADTLASWMRALSVVRNQCAHFGKVLGRRLTSTPRGMRDFPADNTSPFFITLMLGKLLGMPSLFVSDTSLSYTISLGKDVANLIYRFRDVARLMGIPDNWNEVLLHERVTGLPSLTLPANPAVDRPIVDISLIDNVTGMKYAFE